MKTRRAFLLPALFALLCAAAAARQLPDPKLEAAPSTERQTAAVREGIALHDRGDFDGAIRKYEAVLAENPSNALALYEMSYAYSEKKDFKKALEVAYRGAQYKSEHLAGFYLLIGNNLDLLGEADKAVEVYRKGVKLFPGEAMLHFNLAVTYKNRGKLDDARKSLKAAVAANPQHTSSHLLLAVVFYNTGYRTPALLAAARFLALEPSTQRSGPALQIVRGVLGGGATRGANPNQINVTIDPNPKKDEGDFSSVDLILGLSGAVALTDKEKGKSEAQRLAEQTETVLALIGEQDGKKQQSSFVYRYYVPYFTEMKQKGHVEAFVYHALQSSGLPGVREWLAENGGRVMQFLIWSKGYRWPADLKP
jgi:tetratricopeptide (TPR) repeat protein